MKLAQTHPYFIAFLCISLSILSTDVSLAAPSSCESIFKPASSPAISIFDSSSNKARSIEGITTYENFSARHERFAFVRDNGRVVLIAKEDPALIDQLVIDLKSLKGSLPEAALQKSPIGDDLLRIDVTEIVPPAIASKIQLLKKSNMANCFNFCLVESSIAKEHYYTSPEEMDFWIRSPLATKIKNREDLAPGDLIIIKDSTGYPIHGAIYISPRLVLTKNGRNHTAPYELSDIQELQQTYLRLSRSPRTDKPYAQKVEFFRIKPSESYQHVLKALPTLEPLWERASNLETVFSKLLEGEPQDNAKRSEVSLNARNELQQLLYDGSAYEALKAYETDRSVSTSDKKVARSLVEGLRERLRTLRQN